MIDAALFSRLVDAVPAHYMGGAVVSAAVIIALGKGYALLARELRGPAPTNGEPRQSMAVELRDVAAGVRAIASEQQGMRGEIRDCRSDIRGLRVDVDSIVRGEVTPGRADPHAHLVETDEHAKKERGR